jgi:hypothetical protein
MKPSVIVLCAAALGALSLALAATPSAEAKTKPKPAAKAGPPRLDVKPGEELTIPIAIVDGKVVAGAPRAAKLGASKPADGEITVGLERVKGTLYNLISVTEKTAQPIDFLVTGLNGGTKIDETEICGRLDAPIAAHIGSIPWRFWLNGFEVGKGPASCQ